MRWKPRSLSVKLTLATVLTTCAILVLTILVSYLSARRLVEQQTSADAAKEAQSDADKIDNYVDLVAALPRAVAAREEAVAGGAGEFTLPLLAHLLDSTPDEQAFGMYVV